MAYNNLMPAEQQISMEENIAATIFCATHAIDTGVLGEDDCAQLGRDVLAIVLKEFRPDLCDEFQGSAEAEHYRQQATEQWAKDGEIEIDQNAVVSKGDDPGAYVQAWVWVYDDETEEG